jgi:hypothetical protein
VSKLALRLKVMASRIPGTPSAQVVSRVVILKEISYKSKFAIMNFNEVDKVIEKHTVIGLVSASSISKTGKQKLNASGIVCTDNVPKSEFMEEE